MALQMSSTSGVLGWPGISGGACVLGFAALLLSGACTVDKRSFAGGGGEGGGNGTPSQGGALSDAAGGTDSSGGMMSSGGTMSSGGEVSAAGGVAPSGSGGAASISAVGGAALGGANGGASAGGTASGGAVAATGGSVNEACSAEGTFRCIGDAQAARESCSRSVWAAGASCASGETCDSRSGACGKVLAECMGRRPAERYCLNNALIECGPDLQTKTSMTCTGRCIEGSTGAGCASPACGDSVRTADERCDDGNTANGDGCSGACKLEPFAVVAGGQQSCALTSTGVMRCWGDNVAGELGLGDKRARGTRSSDLGAALPAPDLGAHTVQRVALGLDHACAILEDATVRCWGSNLAGRLGQGDTTNRGDDPNEMGATLPVTMLGGSGKSIEIAAGEAHTCAILSGGRVKCWGDNSFGQLGIGNKNAQGDQPAEMGDTLPAVDLGPGRTATQLSLGVSHSCAVLDTELVKCWGNNEHGQLGRGDVDARGDDDGEMGMLTPIDLGSGVLVRAVAAGWNHTCALLKDGTVKCWGANDLGQLGLGDTQARGDGPGEMGTALSAVNLGRSAVAISAGYNHTCALLDDKTVKCWGGNGLGQLGLGDTQHRGDAADELGARLSGVDLGARSVRSLSAARAHTCALLEGGSLRCWGNNASGQLGIGNVESHGAAPNTMGNALPAVNLEF